MAKYLDPLHFDVHVISPRNYMLFTPLLASTAVGTLEFRSIAQPVPSSIPTATYHMAKVTGVDWAARALTVSTETTPGERPLGARQGVLQYDILALACGARNNTFNIPGVLEHAMFLKELHDARAIRQRIITNVQAATFPGVHPRERRRLLSFVIVGGGPTGVEFAAELHDFVVQDLLRLYPDAVSDLSITLIEGKSILGSFDARLREYAERKFKRDAIRIRYGANVSKVEKEEVHLSDGDVLPHGVLVWNTGLAPQPLIAGLSHGIMKDKWRHVLVNEGLQVYTPQGSGLGVEAPDIPAAPVKAGRASIPQPTYEPQPVPPAPPSAHVLPGVYALGDAASVVGRTGNYAATAQVAEQQGAYLAEQLNACARAMRGRVWSPLAAPSGSTAKGGAPAAHVQALQGMHPRTAELLLQAPTAPFTYTHRGSLAMLGSYLAVSDFSSGGPVPAMSGTTMKGVVSWLLWRSAYLTKLGEWRNRVQVPLDWLRTFVFGRDVTAF